MTSPQTENGFTRIANEILEAVQMYKFTLNELKIVMCVWRYTYGFQRKSHQLSLTFLMNHTGLGRTRINDSLKRLIELNVIEKLEQGRANSTNSYAFNKRYDSWKIEKYAVFASVQNDTSVQDGTSVQNDTDTSVQDDTSTSVQNDTSTSVQDDTQERKSKESVKKDIKIAEIADSEIENPVDLKQESEIDIMPDEYVKRLLNRFVELRAYGFDFKPMDLSAAKEIQSAGVPLEEAISGLEEAFRNYNPRHPRDRINSLSYCVGFILDRHFPPTKKSSETPVIPVYERSVPNGVASKRNEQNSSAFGDVQLYS